MIRALLYSPSTKRFEVGDESLIESWVEQPDTYIWIDLTENAADTEANLLRNAFGIHNLAIQDAQRDRHPPKLEDFEQYTFLILKGLSQESTNIDFKTIQLAIFFGERFLISRHSGPSPSVERLREQVMNNPQRYSKGPGVLGLRLCRILIERYQGILLDLEPRLEELEDQMLTAPSDDMLSELISYKSDLKRMRRFATYHEQIFRLLKERPHFGISEACQHEVVDVYEQQERVNSLTNLYHDLASDLIDGYLSVASHRLNQIMKILTIVTAIFVPLSFLAGIYGMNFENMPELHSKSGYFILLGVMVSVAAALLLIFRKKQWM